MRKIIVTSALPYANGDIHIGHLVEYLQTDFWVRFQKMRGNECIYVCADDTHGTPVMVRARKEGITPEELVARSHKQHSADFADFGVAFDNYYTTNSPENKSFCLSVYKKMVENQVLSSKFMPQKYCEHDKMFLPDRFIKGTCPKCGATGQYGDSCDKCGSVYTPSDLIEPHCANCGATPTEKESEHIYFELEPFRDFLKEWLPKHTSADISNKLLEWFGEPLRGWDISRDAPYFGFEIPDRPGKFFYVWVDAPIGYMASMKNWCEKHGESFDDWWNNEETEIYHFIGKDIVRFHCLFWPSMLKCGGFRGPNQVFAHGFLTVNGEKMSKTKGTFISARTYLDCLDPAYLRFYYACKLNGTTDDIDLNLEDFVSRVNSDLVGKIANLASRGAQMLNKSLAGEAGTMDDEGRKIWKMALEKADSIANAYEERDFCRVMTIVREIADKANLYFDSMAPWKLVKTDLELARKVLTSVLNVFRAMAIYLRPVLPVFADKTAELLGEKPYDWSDLTSPFENRKIGAYQYLAVRIDPAKVEEMVEKSRAKNGLAAPAIKPIAPEISIDDFARLDLRVGRVIAAEIVDGSDKLLRLTIDGGEGRTRQIFSGIRKAFSPENIVGKNVVFVANLAPRKMRFGISEGMVICAENLDGKLALVESPAATPGASIS